jgi:uncharacterized protein (TIGR00369 family)
MAALEDWNRRAAGQLPGLLGIHFTQVERGEARAELRIRAELMATNGFLHAATVVALADTCAGFGCMASLPDGHGFTTLELKSNFVGTAREGILDCRATARHLGRTTQVWDAEVTHRDAGAVIALFRCTQLVLVPR